MKLSPERWEERGNYKVSILYRISDSEFSQMVEIKGRVGKHYHRVQTEIFVIIEGNGTLGLDNNIFKVRCGDVFLCTPNTIHFVEGNLRILVFKYNYKKDDTIWLEK